MDLWICRWDTMFKQKHEVCRVYQKNETKNMKPLITVELIRTENGLELVSNTDQIEYDMFVKSIPMGTKVQQTLEIAKDDHSYAQISKLHAGIRELAAETGSTFEEMKDQVKLRAGLVTPDGTPKSFAKCSKDELSQAIQTLIRLGEFVGLSLY